MSLKLVKQVSALKVQQPSPHVLASGQKFLDTYPRNSLWWRLLSRLTIFSTGAISKLFVKAWHRTTVHNQSALHEVFKQAKLENRGIITVMNHVSILDDPLVWGGTTSLKTLASPSKMRWTLGAKDICFRNKGESLFFSLGQVLSVERFGRGPDQPAIDAAITLLSQGKWVHLYPEGFVHQPYDPFEGTLRYFHWGVSRLVLESGPKPPIILPIYGKGLQQVFPEDRQKRTFGYSTNEPIIYAFGTPLDSQKVEDFRARWQALATASPEETTPEMLLLRSEVASSIRSAVLATKEHFGKLMDHELDARLGDAQFWKSQSLVRLKGRSMTEKRERGNQS